MYRLFKLIVVFVVLWALWSLTGCGARVYTSEGVEIAANNSRQFKTTFHNQAAVPILIDAAYADLKLRQKYYIIEPDSSHTFVDTGDWSGHYTVRFWDQEAGDFVGHTLKEFNFSYPTFWHRKVVINPMTLEGRSLQKGRVTNMTGYTIAITDNYGNSYLLANGEIKVYSVPSGTLVLYYQPANARAYYRIWTHSYAQLVDNKPNDVWHLQADGSYQPLGWEVTLREFPWRWHSLR